LRVSWVCLLSACREFPKWDFFAEPHYRTRVKLDVQEFSSRWVAPSCAATSSFTRKKRNAFTYSHLQGIRELIFRWCDDGKPTRPLREEFTKSEQAWWDVEIYREDDTRCGLDLRATAWSLPALPEA
jgi:hypothetical protein